MEFDDKPVRKSFYLRLSHAAEKNQGGCRVRRRFHCRSEPRRMGGVQAVLHNRNFFVVMKFLYGAIVFILWPVLVFSVIVELKRWNDRRKARKRAERFAETIRIAARVGLLVSAINKRKQMEKDAYKSRN